MLPANAVAIQINQKLSPDVKNNQSFSAWNWVAIVLGGAFMVLTIVGTFFEEHLDKVLDSLL